MFDVFEVIANKKCWVEEKKRKKNIRELLPVNQEI